MKAMLNTLAMAALAVAPASQVLAYDGGQSDNTYIEVGVSNVGSPGGTHSPGLAGIGVYTSGIGNRVDFQGLSTYAPADDNGIHNISAPIDVSQPDHSGLGVFSFAQVGGQDVWFGEWSQDGATSFSNRAVFYYGDTSNNSMPTNGVATYTVQGLNFYSGSNELNGTLTANFGAQTLTGQMVDGVLEINVGNATFDSAGVISSSNAQAKVVQNVVSTGTVEGRFYGANAAALAGMATFTNSDFDTSFGGTKD